MKNKGKRGFTLIELLVVIAIIGILSSIVLASLNSARSKGSDAAVQSNISGVRVQAELIYDDDSDYDTVCGANSQTQDTTVKSAIDAANDANGTAGSVTCGKPATGAATAWAIAADLTSGGAFCVDSTGRATDKTTGGTAYTDDVGGTGTPALASANAVVCN
jgi:type IV pilus assembly protein PilA